MLLIFDTNVLQEDYLFKRVHLQAILKEREKLGLRVALPEVSLLEHASHYWRAYSGVLGTLRNLDGPAHALRELDLGSARELIRMRAKDAGIEILPIPNVAHDTLVDRAIRGQRPFSQDGKQGYRDALIWETVKYHATEDDVAFITNDNDFGKGEDGALSPELEIEVQALVNKVKRYRSHKHFFDAVVARGLSELLDIERDLTNGKRTIGEQQDFQNLLKSEMLRHRAEPKDFRLGTGHYSAVRFSSLQEGFKIEQLDARRFHDGDVLLRLTVDVTADLVGEYWVQVGEDDYDRDWDFYNQVPVKVELEVIATTDIGAVSAISIKRITQAASATEGETFEH